MPQPIMAKFGEQLERGADGIVKDAQQSILDGSISGPGHVPSAPGEPPNNDTGALHDSGFVTAPIDEGDQIRAAAGFDAPYAGYLENGTSKMYPRPFLVPATERQRGNVLHGLAERFREIVGLR